MPLLTVCMLLCIRGEIICEGVRAVFASLPSLPHSKLHSPWHSSATRIAASRRLTFLPKVRQVPFKKRDKFPHNQHSDTFVIAWVTFSPPAISTGRPCLISHLRLDNYIPTNKSTKMHACIVQSIPCYLAEKKEKRKDYNKRAHGQPQHTHNNEIKMMRMNGRMAQTSSSSLSFYPLQEKWRGGCNQKVCPPPKYSNCTKHLLERMYTLSGKNCMGPYHTSLFAYDGDLRLQLEASQRLVWLGLAWPGLASLLCWISTH